MLKKKTPLVFGEVLYDKFSEENRVLGGAPFNVACHLQGFGLQPYFVSRVGNDENGKNVIQKMKEWGLSTEGLQQDDTYPTGIVSVTTENGEPQFEICSEQAYDFIDIREIQNFIKGKSFSLIYNGTLALRNKTSRDSLKMLKQKTGSKVFLDINLRKPWWDHNKIVQEMNEADWVKCNFDELKIITQSFNMNDGEWKKQTKHLCKYLGLELLIITLGGKGAFVINNLGQNYTMEPLPVPNLIDTVGAGDAFSAVTILGILKEWELQTILKRAIEFSAKMCQVNGATLNDKQFYENMLKKWNNQNVR